MQTVLIVDDDVKLLKMLQRTLVYEGLQVVTASNGEEALNQVDVCKPDLIILDWMMPKMDGLSVDAGIARRKESSHDPDADRPRRHRESRRRACRTARTITSSSRLRRRNSWRASTPCCGEPIQVHDTKR